MGLGVLGAYLGANAAAAHVFIHPPRREIGAMPQAMERVSLTGPLGQALPTWAALPADGKPVFLLIHGYGGAPGEWAGLAEALITKGGGAVAPAMRGQTESPVPGVAFGLGESREAVRAAEWIKGQRPSSPIVIVGLSMGGAAAWLAAKDRPELFHAVATEGSFAEFDEGLQDYLAHAAPGGRVLMAPLPGIGRLISGIDPASISPREAASAWQGRPALVIHSRQDRLFPFRHGEALARASGAEFWALEKTEHAKGMRDFGEEYSERIWALSQPAKAP
jgi:pimeloyl-ACP methyl ester carboxylesterase